MSSTDALLDRCAALGITLWVDGDQLHYDGPEAVITPSVLDVLRAHKAPLLAALRDRRPRSPEMVTKSPKPHFGDFVTISADPACAPATPPGVELGAHSRQAELVIITYRLRRIRELPLDEAEALFAAYQCKLAKWRAFLTAHAEEAPDLLGSLDRQLRQHVARMRLRLHVPPVHPRAPRRDGWWTGGTSAAGPLCGEGMEEDRR
jgi:hypothetical protein